jgi:hypothetical protein
VYYRASEGCIADLTITNIFEAGLYFGLWKIQRDCQSSAVSHCKCFFEQDVALIRLKALSAAWHLLQCGLVVLDDHSLSRFWLGLGEIKHNF